MELDFDKYSKVRKTKAPNSERAEQVQKVVEITGKPFKQIAGLTKHLQPHVMYRLFQESKGDPRLWWHIYKQKYAINNMTKVMKQMLTDFPDFRERKHKNLFLAKHVLRITSRSKETVNEFGHLEKETKTLLEKMQNGEKFELTDFALFGKNFSSKDRDWRDTLRDNPELRGSDYNEKDDLEEIWVRKLGYIN